MLNNERFTKAQRLSEKDRIRDLRYNGERFRAKPFVIYRLPNELPEPRIAIAVTRRAGNAVQRNYARRKAREFFRKSKKPLGGFDYFFFSSYDLKTVSRRDWQAMAESILRWCDKK